MSEGRSKQESAADKKDEGVTNKKEKLAKVQDRESRESTPNSSEKSLTEQEREAVAEHGNLSALTNYSIIRREGEEELKRPVTSLWWSGVTAGIGISTSVLVEGIIRSNLGSEHPYLTLFESLGYTFGFVLVILGRLQLFTENTLTVVLPVLAEPTRAKLFFTARLWGVVLLANLCGTFFIATISVHGGILSADILAAILELSRHATTLEPTEALLRGIPSGFFIAALVWMLPSAKSSEVLVIIMFTWLISAGGFTHVVVGSTEIFNVVLAGEMNIFTAFFYYIFPVLIGNILGGTGLFAMLAYGQVHEEM